MIETFVAGIGLALCIVMLTGMLLGARRRARAAAALRRAWQGPQRRRAAKQAARGAIERARRGVEKEGNVYRPRSFTDRPPDNKLH